MTRGRTVATMAGVFALLASAIVPATSVRADRDEEGERSGGYEHEGEHERGAQPAPPPDRPARMPRADGGSRYCAAPPPGHTISPPSRWRIANA